MPPLSEAAIRNIKPSGRVQKVWDAGGLFLFVSPSGGRWWRLKYRIRGREKLLSLGTYPDVSLKLARDKRDDARKHIAAGVDPSAERRKVKFAEAITFERVAQEWLGLQAGKLSAQTIGKAQWLLREFVFPEIGAEPVSQITAAKMLECLRKIEARGIRETAHRTRQRCGQILRYAIATGRAERDVTADLRGALAPVLSKNHAAITDPARVGELLRAIEGYTGQPVTAFALRLAPFVFLRPGELRGAEWSEIEGLDSKEPLWRIPAARMKIEREHLVPLSTQAATMLKSLHSLTGGGRFLFPSLTSAARPMSDNTMNAALRRLGYTADEMTPHGFRSLASTLLNEQGWHPDLIELQLAHLERNKVRAAYNKAQRLAERRKMMQAWADYLDELRKVK